MQESQPPQNHHQLGRPPPKNQIPAHPILTTTPVVPPVLPPVITQNRIVQQVAWPAVSVTLASSKMDKHVFLRSNVVVTTEPGEVIWSDACTSVCHCLGNFSIRCTNTSCAPDEYCGDKDGVYGCHLKGSSTCTASGDPHYTSFDKKKFNFHGNCTYVMSQTCNSTQTPFSVYASNEHRNGKKTVSYVKAVYVQVYGITVSILKKKVVQVNGKTVTVPINPVREVTIKPSGKHVVVQTDFGLIVRYDGKHHMDIKVPSNYADELCGLCGDYNGSPSDDFRTPEGKLVKGVNDFGNSWNVDDK
ncbi:zonadhesin-like [Callorhinchus milii]|uniref:zonadhesin-like n=1 Tax=Callorhinchus milii TaxID=7868 RepID=UPI001C3F52B1|nr:zonadhesin-like [Callorhinchus milii]